jgi:hypothetical protein
LEKTIIKPTCSRWTGVESEAELPARVIFASMPAAIEEIGNEPSKVTYSLGANLTGLTL